MKGKGVSVHIIRVYGLVELQFQSLLNLVLDGGGYSTSAPRREPQYLLNRRLVGPHSWSEHLREANNFEPMLGIESSCLSHRACCLIIM
jgi:hypothetical protein